MDVPRNMKSLTVSDKSGVKIARKNYVMVLKKYWNIAVVMLDRVFELLFEITVYENYNL